MKCFSNKKAHAKQSATHNISSRKKGVFPVLIAFASGIWLDLGINPEKYLFLASLTQSIINSPLHTLIMVLIPIIFFLIVAFTLYMRGKLFGLVSAIIAFAAGLYIITVPMFGIVGLIIAIVLGFVSSRK